jgi:hypothetical protein
MIEMDLNKICYIVVKARAFDAQEDVVEPDYGSDAVDDQFRQVLEAYADDPTFGELKQAVDDLNIDEQCQLVALAWLGRGDYGVDDWDDAVQTARDAHTEHTAAYLGGMPLLADFLEEGLAAFDLSCEDFEMGHL